MDGNNLLPGMEDFIEPEEEDYFSEGKPGSKYFDATNLPDAPGYARNAQGNQTYILHIAFPTYEELTRGVIALTAGERKKLSANAKEGSINGVAIRKGMNMNWLQYWEQALLSIEPELPSEEEDTEPEIIPGEEYPEDKPKKKEKKEKKKKPVAKRVQKKEIAVITKFPSELSITDEDVMIAFPTYKRSDDVKTWKYFDPGVAVAFVEPQELHLYRALHPEQNLLVYHENDMTINQKRKFIVNHAIRCEKKWLFMLEDDLTGFFKRQGKTAGGSHKLVRCEYKEVMNSMLNFANANDIVELGLSQQQSNHFYEEEYVAFACKVTEFCLFNLHGMDGVNYDAAMPHFEDFDISVQLLVSRKKVGLYTPYAFGHVTMATNKSGGFMHEGMEKRKQIAEKAIEMMAKKFPGIVSRKDGRLFPEPKIEWSLLRENIGV